MFPGLGGFAQFDERADVWSLGVTMYALITGAPLAMVEDQSTYVGAGLDGGGYMRMKMANVGCPTTIQDLVLKASARKYHSSQCQMRVDAALPTRSQ